MYRNRMLSFLSTMIMIAAVVAMTGCWTGKRASSAKFSGWMTQDEYKMLQQNQGKDKPIYGYNKPDMNFAFYKKMLLDPVVIYRSELPTYRAG
jgi:hypothetical protein